MDEMDPMDPKTYASFNDMRTRVADETLLECFRGHCRTTPNPTIQDIEPFFMKAVAIPATSDFHLRWSTIPLNISPDARRGRVLDWYLWRLAMMYPAVVRIDTGALWRKMQDDLEVFRALSKRTSTGGDPEAAASGATPIDHPMSKVKGMLGIANVDALATAIGSAVAKAVGPIVQPSIVASDPRDEAA